MSYIIGFNDRALRDLEALYEWIAIEASTDIADAYDARLRRSILSLDAFPNRRTPRPKWGPDFRSFTFERRRIVVYRVSGAMIEILRVLHATRGDDDLSRD